MADPPGSKFAMLQELQRRQQAILGGLQGQSLYPEVGEQPRDHDGVVEMSDAPPANVGDFSQAQYSPAKQRQMDELAAAGDKGVADMRGVSSNEYEYKPEYQGAPGTAPGRHVGPMAQDLEHLPGVVETGPDGMKRVNAPRLSMANASVAGELSRSDESKTKEIDQLKRRLAALEAGTSGNADDTLKNAQSGRY